MTTNSRDVSDHGSKYVRLFYSLVLIHDMKGTSFLNEKAHTALQDMPLEIEILDSLALQCETFLGADRFQIAYDEKIGVRPCNQQKSTYNVPFLLSTIHEFKPEDLVRMPGSANFRIKADVFSSVQNALAKEIRDLLTEEVSIRELHFSMATSRIFIFDVYYEGNFRVKREFSDHEIKSSGGVREVLMDYFEGIQLALEPFGFEITSSPSNHRRNRDDEYSFGFYYAPNVGFNESEVHGNGSYAIRGDASIDEINHYCVGFDDVRLEEAKANLVLVLEENFPSDANLLSYDIFYVDDSDEVIDVDDELLPITDNAERTLC